MSQQGNIVYPSLLDDISFTLPANPLKNISSLFYLLLQMWKISPWKRPIKEVSLQQRPEVDLYYMIKSQLSNI